MILDGMPFNGVDGWDTLALNIFLRTLVHHIVPSGWTLEMAHTRLDFGPWVTFDWRGL